MNLVCMVNMKNLFHFVAFNTCRCWVEQTTLTISICHNHPRTGVKREPNLLGNELVVQRPQHPSGYRGHKIYLTDCCHRLSVQDDISITAFLKQVCIIDMWDFINCLSFSAWGVVNDGGYQAHTAYCMQNVFSGLFRKRTPGTKRWLLARNTLGSGSLRAAISAVASFFLGFDLDLTYRTIQ
mmetsp:Transcript_8899/g.11544  ORF Transcript_8899/g.11544 Transcript_8899/m.11544 type:complete len:182 (+) Transcript_8899:331-876(+)